MPNTIDQVIDETFDPARLSARLDRLTAVFKSSPERFAPERHALARATAHLEEQKQLHAEAIARRDDHLRLIEAARLGGALSEWELNKVLQRLKQEDAVPSLDQAQSRFDEAERAFWGALKRREKELQGQPSQ